MGIADLTRVTRLSTSLSHNVELAQLHLSLGEIGTALGSLKECLRSDPEHKECKKEYRKIKKIEKSFKEVEDLTGKGKWRQVMPKLEGENGLLAVAEQIDAPALNKQVWGWACRASGQTKKHSAAGHWCGKVLELDGDDFEALYWRGESKMANEDWQGAMADFQKAHQINQHDQRVSSPFSPAPLFLVHSSFQLTKHST